MRYFFTHLTETERAETKLSKEKFNNVFLDAISYQLKKSNIHQVTTHSEKIKFKAPIFRFIWNGFHFLNPISKAEIELKRYGKSSYISYKIYFWEFFVYALIFSTIPLMCIFPNMLFRVISLAIIWMIYAISTLIAANRFENYLRNLVDDINLNVSEKNPFK